MLSLKDLPPNRELAVLKVASIFSGIFLIIAGFFGPSAVVLGGGFAYVIASLYAIFFGCLVITVEIKDKSALISVAYDLINVYLKFLTIQV